MSDAANRTSLSADMAAEDFGLNKNPIGDRAFAAAYLTTIAVAMIGWLYVITRAGLAAISWMIFG
ncbi:hypothetical protein [Bradyrhizobium arachidis]|uniref:hypothetical protein n=1 Tax=Bradyrhizobium arachidis TaxID=858423 RepID=UPI0008EBE9C1|nr:hypothetical protein [Bradyrhizobium arachidis]SFV17214.1 hypothetical protein SAMN05192541_127118 [Bradyrhizobium arachidis]